jgi:hypothetical protein
MLSLPAPPVIVSLPAPPLSLSLPPAKVLYCGLLLRIVSLPAPPSIVSLPTLPQMTLAFSSPVPFSPLLL